MMMVLHKEKEYAEHIEKAEKATDRELYIAAEQNEGQLAERGVYKGELNKRRVERQDKLLQEQIETSRSAATSAQSAARSSHLAAIATGLAAVAAFGQLILAYVKP